MTIYQKMILQEYATNHGLSAWPVDGGVVVESVNYDAHGGVELVYETVSSLSMLRKLLGY